MAWRRTVDRVLRPVLDAAQVMPAFVYLIPVLGTVRPQPVLRRSWPTRVRRAGGRQAGRRRRPPGLPTAVEAATAAGSTPVAFVQGPALLAARRYLVLAANLGLLYVLSMVVIGGLVGGGGLGYDYWRPLGACTRQGLLDLASLSSCWPCWSTRCAPGGRPLMRTCCSRSRRRRGHRGQKAGAAVDHLLALALAPAVEATSTRRGQPARPGRRAGRLRRAGHGRQPWNGYGRRRPCDRLGCSARSPRTSRRSPQQGLRHRRGRRPSSRWGLDLEKQYAC